jgi:hypothetical protein
MLAKELVANETMSGNLSIIKLIFSGRSEKTFKIVKCLMESIYFSEEYQN